MDLNLTFIETTFIQGAPRVAQDVILTYCLLTGLYKTKSSMGMIYNKCKINRISGFLLHPLLRNYHVTFTYIIAVGSLSDCLSLNWHARSKVAWA